MKKKQGCLGTVLKIFLFLIVAMVVLDFFGSEDLDEDYEEVKYPGYSGGSSAFVPTTAPAQGNTASINTQNTGADTATVMIYMIGSDLETQSGCATADLQEMCYANLGSNVNLVVQAGGAKRWNNNIMKSGKVGRYAYVNGNPVQQQDLGNISMVESSNVASFITWAAGNYPADRYVLIFWDHGGGTIMGFGSDEMYPRKMLSLNDINSALGKAGVHFDFIGFDACLMGTVETAYAMSDYADYMIGAEETEPGGGWYYTNWLSMLGSDPGTNTEVLGRKIIDDFVSHSSYYEETTLSLIRLDKIGAVYEALSKYLNTSNTVLCNSGYGRISGARGAAKSFGSNEFEQIDIISYLNAAGDIEGAEEVRRTVKEAVVYAGGNVADAHGLAMYYPYNQLSYYSGVMNMLDLFGYNDYSYVDYFNTFVNDLAHGQYYGRSNSRSLSPAQQLTGYTAPEPEADYSDEDWYDESAADPVDLSAVLTVDGMLELKEKNGSYVVELTDEQWNSISYVEVQMMVDDGEGYLDFGTDTAVDYTDDGDLSADFDFLWVTLDGYQIVPFFTIEDKVDANGKWHAIGYVPATLNDEVDIEIICYWDEETKEGMIRGYRHAVEGEELTLPQRSLLQLKEGDRLDFYCDYYTYDGEYDASYYVGETLTVGPDGLTLGYMEMDYIDTVVIAFRLVDLYQNEYWTETLEITLEG